MKKLFLGISLLGILGIGASVSIPKTGYCYDCESKIGDQCSGDYACSPYTCNLKCAKINKYSYTGRCVISY